MRVRVSQVRVRVGVEVRVGVGVRVGVRASHDSQAAMDCCRCAWVRGRGHG